MSLKSPALLLLAGLLSIQVPVAFGQEMEPRTSSLTAIDRTFMEDQRSSVDQLARTHLGRSAGPESSPSVRQGELDL